MVGEKGGWGTRVPSLILLVTSFLRSNPPHLCPALPPGRCSVRAAPPRRATEPPSITPLPSRKEAPPTPNTPLVWTRVWRAPGGSSSRQSRSGRPSLGAVSPLAAAEEAEELRSLRSRRADWPGQAQVRAPLLDGRTLLRLCPLLSLPLFPLMLARFLLMPASPAGLGHPPSFLSTHRPLCSLDPLTLFFFRCLSAPPFPHSCLWLLGACPRALLPHVPHPGKSKTGVTCSLLPGSLSSVSHPGESSRAHARSSSCLPASAPSHPMLQPSPTAIRFLLFLFLLISLPRSGGAGRPPKVCLPVPRRRRRELCADD